MTLFLRELHFINECIFKLYKSLVQTGESSFIYILVLCPCDTRLNKKSCVNFKKKNILI